MANTYNWTITGLNNYPQHKNQSNVVYRVYWTCIGTSEDTPLVTATINDSIPVNYVNENPFTPYENLTQEEVVGWVKNHLNESGIAAIQLNIDNQISNKKSNNNETFTLPW